MLSSESTTQSVSAPSLAAIPVAHDDGLDGRWDAWILRGRLHEQRARRRFVTWAAIVVLAAALAYAVFG